MTTNKNFSAWITYNHSSPSILSRNCGNREQQLSLQNGYKRFTSTFRVLKMKLKFLLCIAFIYYYCGQGNNDSVRAAIEIFISIMNYLYIQDVESMMMSN